MTHNFCAIHQAHDDGCDAPFNPCNYHAGHRCRKCQVHITDHEYLASGLFLSLCPPCLASARQTLRELTK